MKTTDFYRELPAIDELLAIRRSRVNRGRWPSPTTDACRAVLGRLREEIAGAHLDETKLRLALAGIPAAIRNELSQS